MNGDITRAVNILAETIEGEHTAEHLAPVEALPARLARLVSTLGGSLKQVRVVNAASGAEIRYDVGDDGKLHPSWEADETRPEDGRKNGSRKVGVIAELASALTASKAPGMTKQELVDRIVLTTGREPRHIESTVRTQLSRLPQVDGLKIEKTRVGRRVYYHAH